MQASGLKSFSPRFGGVAQDERVLARRAEFIDREHDRLRADRRDAHPSERRAGRARDTAHWSRHRGASRPSGRARVVEQNSGEPQIAHRRPQLVRREERHERIATAVSRTSIRLRGRSSAADRRVAAATLTDVPGRLVARFVLRRERGRLHRGLPASPALALRAGFCWSRRFCSASMCAFVAATALLRRGLRRRRRAPAPARRRSRREQQRRADDHACVIMAPPPSRTSAASRDTCATYVCTPNFASRNCSSFFGLQLAGPRRRRQRQVDRRDDARQRRDVRRGTRPI